MTLRTASNEGSSNDAERGSSTSSFNPPPGWRWRRELCLTERTQQCQSGPNIKGWLHDRCNRVDRDACRRGNVMTRVRHRQSNCEKQCQTLERNACRRGNVRRVRGAVWARAESTARTAGEREARAGCTDRTRSTREWTALLQRTWQTTELQRHGTCGQHRLGTRRWQRQSECGWHRQAATPG